MMELVELGNLIGTAIIVGIVLRNTRCIGRIEGLLNSKKDKK